MVRGARGAGGGLGAKETRDRGLYLSLYLHSEKNAENAENAEMPAVEADVTKMPNLPSSAHACMLDV